MSVDTASRERVALRGRRLEYLTIGWNCIEGAVGIGAGLIAGSISLVGFGVDSVIEVTSGAALLWRMSHDSDPVGRERVEQRTLRIVGSCFLVLSAYLAWEAVSQLLTQRAPSHSAIGVALAIVSLIVMPLLSRAKRQVASALHSRAMSADAMQTQLCAYLSVILLGGLVLNAFWDVWWADPVAALVMIPIVVREGLQALRGDACHCCQSADDRRIDDGSTR